MAQLNKSEQRLLAYYKRTQQPNCFEAYKATKCKPRDFLRVRASLIAKGHLKG